MPLDTRSSLLRVAVVLPARRLWRWHERLLAESAKQHTVTAFVDEHAPAYPRAVRAWLAAELALYSDGLNVSPTFTARRLLDARGLQMQDFDRIVDLSESEPSFPGSLVLRYDGGTDSTVLIGALLARRTPQLAVCSQKDGEIRTSSRLAVDDKSRLSRGLELAFGRCISLIERALRADAPARAIPPAPASAARPASLAAHALEFCLERARRIAARLLQQRERHWSIALRRGSGPFTIIPDDRRRYYGDPFLLAWRGRTFLFVEELPYATGKGVISAVEIVDGRPDGSFEPVLERPYHLSYPFVFVDGDGIYMLPEATGSGRVELYRATDFPRGWQLERVLIEDQALADATPVYHCGRWWLFGTAAAYGTTDHDELLIFHSKRLTGPWRPHARTPVKSDCRSARPAGRLLVRGGRLLRPVQDCEASYGAGIVWHEITELTPEDFAEREIACWEGRRDLGVTGLHSFDQIGELQAIDIKRVSGPGRSVVRLLEPRAGSALECAFPVRAIEHDFLARERTGAASAAVGPEERELARRVDEHAHVI
ncbi:MAG: hypothetical protein IT537_20580 [Hyphomicrobiales bacterium]|nr:hypothetical protein [Hyphomicrobiales bacterium]